MPTFSLIPHPDYPPLIVSGVVVEVWGGPSDLMLRYDIVGADKVVMPGSAQPGPVEGLWKTTCFELFLGFDDGEHYVEFNYSPSTCWAAYAFDGYREGMSPLDLQPSPDIESYHSGIEVNCVLPDLPRGDHRMALTAVIEEEGGIKSYWALAHPPGAPDFHAPACFTARLHAPDMT